MGNMKISAVLKNIFVLYFLMAVAPVWADGGGATEWDHDKARLENLISENLTEDQRCQVIWNILWSWTKKREFDANFALAKLSYSGGFPGVPRMILPGRIGDEISSRRDSVILLIGLMDLQQEKSPYSGENYETFFSGWPKGESFLQCMKSESPSYCAKYATRTGDVIDTQLVPSIEQFSTEVDSLIAQGMKPKCKNFENFYLNQKFFEM